MEVRANAPGLPSVPVFSSSKLSALAFGLLAATALVGVAHLVSDGPGWARAALWLLAAGVMVGGVAVVAGLVRAERAADAPKPLRAKSWLLTWADRWLDGSSDGRWYEGNGLRGFRTADGDLRP
jgi:hypothetical protein